MPITEKLAYLKQRRGLTTEEISQKTDIPVGTLNKIFSGQTLNPSLKTLSRLFAFFQVPAHYLLDDSTPVSCSICARDESDDILMLSDRERELFFHFRQLDDYSRRHLEFFLQYLLRQSLHCNKTTRRLICYLPICSGRSGVFADSFHFRAITVPLSPIIQAADYAIYVLTNSLEPAYPPGTLLAIKREDAEHNQMGLFVLNGEAFVRNLYAKRGIRKLVSLNVDKKNIIVNTEDDFCCLGVILGAIRNYHWT